MSLTQKEKDFVKELTLEYCRQNTLFKNSDIDSQMANLEKASKAIADEVEKRNFIFL